MASLNYCSHCIKFQEVQLAYIDIIIDNTSVCAKNVPVDQCTVCLSNTGIHPEGEEIIQSALEESDKIEVFLENQLA